MPEYVELPSLYRWKCSVCNSVNYRGDQEKPSTKWDSCSFCGTEFGPDEFECVDEFEDD